MTHEQLFEVNKTIEEWGLKNVENIILIKSATTNGDMLKALFPNERIGHCEDCTDLGDIATFDDNWWNALYQKGDKECYTF